MVGTVTFNQAMLAKDRVFAIRAGTYTSSDIKEASFNYGYISGDAFKPGGTVAGSAKLTFTSIITSFNKLDKVYPEIGLKVGDSFEWVAMGEYFVNDINIDRNRNTTELDLIDGMFKLNQPYISDLNYPAQIRDVIREICVKTGVELETDDLGFRAIQHHIQSKADKKDITFREVLSQAIQLLGFSAFFNRKGKLEIRGLIESNITITADNYFLHGLTKSELMYQIAGITCKKDKETLTVGLRTGRSLELENNFMIQNILDDLYYDLKNIRYYPYSLDWQGHLKLDVGQWVTLKTNKNETFKVPVLSQSFNFKGGLKSKIGADSKAGNDTQYAYKGFLGKRIKQMSTEIEAEVQQQLEYKDKEFDEKINKVKSEINDGIEQAQAEAERHADAIKQAIDTEIAQVNQSMQAQSEEHDRQVADILSKTQSVESLANQAKSDAASAITQALQFKNEAIADARAQVATVSQALNTAKSELQTAIASADQKARDNQASATALRNDLNLQASKILAQARAQTALTNRVSTVETLADGTRSTVADLSKTVSKATGDITSVTSRTKTVEDTLSQTRTQYEALTQTVNTQTGQIDSINRKTADLQSGIDGVTERFDSLQVGGENLLLNAGFEDAKDRSETFTVGGVVYTNKLMPKWGSLYNSGISNPTTSYHAIYLESFNGKGPVIEFNESNGQRNWKALYQTLQASDLRVGKYTFSADIFATGVGTKIQFGIYYYNKAGQQSFHSGLTTIDISTINKWHRVSGNLKLNDDIDFNREVRIYIYAYNFTTNSILYLTKPQLEYGTIATQFRLAQETLRSEIASYKRTADEASAELSRQIQTVDGKAVDAKTYAQQTATAINTRLESLETYKNAEGTRASQYFTASRDETARQVSALRAAVTQDYVAKSVFEETARGISQRFESLYVGGTNLLTGTDEYTEIFNSEQSHAEFLRTPYDLAPVFDKYGLIEYTLSFDLRASQAGQVVVYQQNGSGSKYSGLWKNLTVTTEWQRFHVTFTPTEGTMSLANSYLAFYGTYGTGVKPIIRRVKIERGAIATDWSLALEDQLSYADTKIAEYKTTVDGRFATLQSQKANQVDLQTVRETVNLYERIIGSTETGIKDKVARMVMADSLFLTEVKDKISGTATQVSQLNNSYAIKNLTSAGTVLNQINLLANGTNRIDGRLTHITGQTLIDNGVIKNAMIGSLDAGKITSGYLSAARIATNSIDGSKMVFDQAFVNKMTANEALFKQLFAKNAFITSVQAVTLSASQITGGLMRATNRAMEVNLNAGQILYYTDQAALKRVLNGYPTQFVKFATGTVTGKGNAGVTVIGSNRWNSESSNDGGFVGIRAWNGANIDQIDVVGDTVRLASSAFEAADGWNINTLPGKLDIDAFNADHRASSKIKVGDLWLWKNATTYSSMRDTINLIIDNLQLLHNNKSTERGYTYTLPAKV
ncbi:gp58-like family protein [Streptococcus suis]|uniref:gp58-like family protein n=2 Tax=Streptococcus suis TaxID=1307 RepID=UPI002AB48264|nr:gp58-like family protein [Streptococcus suis]MDY7596694.1 gp58-like family protein [Streptococcus suis]